MRTQMQRMQTLLKRINKWEDESVEEEGIRETIWALDDAEELILNIKQCLESLVRDY